MTNQKVVRALFLGGLAVLFLLGAVQLPVGQLSRPGPGLFPIVVGLMLLASALLMGVQTGMADAVRMDFNARNIAIIMGALIAFVIGAKLVNTAVAVVLLIFIASLASPDRSWKRNVAVSAALILVAFAFQKFLGLNLQVI